MIRKPALLLAALIATASLGGCVLSSQVITVSDSNNVTSAEQAAPRTALVRVEDKRSVAADLLGNRGGRDPRNSPLLASKPLAATLTRRLQATILQMGLGVASPYEPLKIQMDIETFEYQCNEGVLVNSCSLKIGLRMTVLDGGKSWSKPFMSEETRSVATAPAAVYNEEWVNEAMDRIWQRIFTDPGVRERLGISG